MKTSNNTIAKKNSCKIDRYLKLFLKGLNKILSVFSNLKYVKLYYSQSGEDIFFEHLFKNIKSGFYIDIGAHHSKRYSNTYLLYKKGWHGINIDPDRRSFSELRKNRHNDINLNIGISTKNQNCYFYTFSDGAINTISKKEAQKWEVIKREKSQKVLIKTRTLKYVIAKYKNPEQKINLLTLDTEGHDLQVLRSNNFKKYRPEYICVEMLDSLTAPENKKINIFLSFNNYALCGKTTMSAIYRDNKNESHNPC